MMILTPNIIGSAGLRGLFPAGVSSNTIAGVGSLGGSGALSASYTYYQALLDTDGSYYWCSESGVPWHWQLNAMPTPRRIYRYQFRNGGGVDRGPKDWLFQGSNDGASWTTLHNVTNRDGHPEWDVDNTVRQFRPEATGLYTYYRIYVSANEGGAALRTALRDVQFYY